MAIGRVFTYLGKTTEGYHMWECNYTALLTDTYLRATRIVMEFTGLSSVSGVIGYTNFADDGNNLGNPLALVSVSSRTVTLMMLETGAGAGVGLAEKTNAEAYGDAVSIRCAVYGV